MTDPGDLGNEKAAVIFADQRRQQEQTARSNRYLIAHCSGDGELVVKLLTGSKEDRSYYMLANSGDPVKTSNWAFTQWTFETRSAGSWGKILAGNGEMEQKLREYIAEHKPFPR